VTGDRRRAHGRGGYAFAHVCIDDHSRLAYVEILPDERAETAAAFLRRAVRWLRRQGIRAERVLTDNGGCYASHEFAGARQRPQSALRGLSPQSRVRRSR
jgi:hypothetical protein